MSLQQIALDSNWLKDRKTIKSKVKELVSEWLTRLKLQGMTFDVSFYRSKYTATCYFDREYKRVYLNFYIPEVVVYCENNYDLEELVVHELLHLCFWSVFAKLEEVKMYVEPCDAGFYEEVKSFEESTTETMSHALVLAKYGMSDTPEDTQSSSDQRESRPTGCRPEVNTQGTPCKGEGP